jgi:adhesin transport system outer membrane protein
VFSGFRNPGNLNIAKIDQLIADQELNNVTQTLLFRGYEVYISVLATQDLEGLAKANVSSIQQQLDRERARSEVVSTELDVLFVESRLQVAKENQVFFRGRFDDALVQFQRIIGRPPSMSGMVSPELPDPLIPGTLDQALEKARENNPTLQTADALIDRAAEEETVAAADHFPQLDIVAETNYENDFDGTEGSRNDYFVGLRARWKLFSGFGTQAAVAAAKQNKFSLRDKALDARRGVEEDVGRSWENMETANERVGLLVKAVDIAGRVFDLRRKQRELGRESEINVLDAQQELFRAQIQLVEAKLVQIVARYRLLQAMGVLTPENMGL